LSGGHPVASAEHHPCASVSVVVPVYNSENTLNELCKRLVSVLRSCSSTFEIILVDDGSHDASWDRCVQIAEEMSHVLALKLMKNYGQHNALLCGIRLAKYEVIVTLDDDLQNPPEEIPSLLEQLARGFDVVYGTPQSQQHGFWRNRASQITKLVLKRAMGASVARQISAFRAFRIQLRDAFTDYRGSFVSIDVLLTWATRRFTAVRVRHMARAVGESNYTVGRLLTHAVNMMTGFSTLPLQLASIIGFACALLGAIVLIYVVGRVLIQGVSVPGFAFLASIVAIFSGAQLFSIGIIGEYLARMHFRAMDQPSYVVQDRVGQAPGTDVE